MAEWSTIDCQEIAATVQESISLTQRRGRVTLKCAWSDRYDLINDTVGLSRIWPYENPANFYAMRASNASEIRPFAGPRGTAVAGSPQLLDYDYAYVTIEYTPLQTPTDPQAPYTAFTETITPFVEWTKCNHEEYTWADSAEVALDETPQVQWGRMEFIRTYYNWTGPMPIEYLSYQGTCNNAPVTSAILNLTFGTETLAYNAGNATQTIQSDGTRSQNLELTFNFKTETWNKFWRSKTFSYENMFLIDPDQPGDVGAQIKPYTPADYSVILL